MITPDETQLVKNNDFFYHRNDIKAITCNSPSFINSNANNNELQGIDQNKATNVQDNNSQTSFTIGPKENEAAT